MSLKPQSSTKVRLTKTMNRRDLKALLTPAADWPLVANVLREISSGGALCLDADEDIEKLGNRLRAALEGQFRIMAEAWRNPSIKLDANADDLQPIDYWMANLVTELKL